MVQIIEGPATAVGHYSAAAIGAGLVFVSGQAPIDPRTGKPVDGDFRAKARQALRNVEAALEASGCIKADVVKTTVFLHDWNDFAALNEVYKEFFPGKPPARSTVQGSRPPGHLLAIEAIAVAPPTDRSGRA